MFENFSSIQNILNTLHPMYIGQVSQAGPIMGILEIKAVFTPIDSPPAHSPVDARLVNLSYKTWVNISKPLKQFRKLGSRVMGKTTYEAWSKTVIQFEKNKSRLLAVTIPLFIEGVMQSSSSSPAPAQKVLTDLIRPIIDSDESINPDQMLTNSQHLSPNAKIIVFLIAGKTPFAITCHTLNTINIWRDYLEAGSILLSPQVIMQAQIELPENENKFMLSAFQEMLNSWDAKKPITGEVRDWIWLPKLG